MRTLHLVLLFVLPLAVCGALAGHAQPIDPADAADAAIAAASATLPPPAQPGADKGMLLALAAAAGALIRVVIIPLLKSPLGGRVFKQVPPFVQQLILVLLACGVAAIEKIALGGTILDAILAALAAYGTASALYGVTAPALEHRRRAAA